MSEPIDPNEWVARMKSWLRSEYVASFEAGLAWGRPRCRTDEERLLYPCLLVVLSPFAAVVAQRRLDEGDAAAFQVSVGRDTASGPDRRHIIVRAAPDADRGSDEGPIPDPNRIPPAELVRSDPWAAAGRVAAKVQAAIMAKDE